MISVSVSMCDVMVPLWHDIDVSIGVSHPSSSPLSSQSMSTTMSEYGFVADPHIVKAAMANDEPSLSQVTSHMSHASNAVEREGDTKNGALSALSS